MRALLLLALGLAVAAAAPSEPQRIIGGSVTNINNYRFAAALLFLRFGVYSQACGGTVINNRAILTAAHCTFGDGINLWRARVGSTTASSGGTVFTSARFINHPSYNPRTFDSDIGLIHVNGNLLSNTVVRAGQIAGSNYNLGDNQVVWAIGWGLTSVGGWSSEQLRHVQIWAINQAICRQRYAELGRTITDNMLCSGWLDVGGRDQCQGDSGGPLLHNNVVVGVCSWGERCALARYPGVNVRVSRFTNWITSNA